VPPPLRSRSASRRPVRRGDGSFLPITPGAAGRLGHGWGQLSPRGSLTSIDTTANESGANGSLLEHARPVEGVHPRPLTSTNIPGYPWPCDRSIRRRRSRRRCVSRSCAGGASSQQHRDTGGERSDAATGNERDAESRSGRRLETQVITRRTSAGGFSGAPTRAPHLGPGDS
jgi:hypothetical protein